MIQTNSYMDLYTESLKKMAGALMNNAGGDAGLAEGTNSGTVKTASSVTTILQGIAQSSKSSTDNIDPTPDDGPATIPDGKKVVLGVFLDSSQDAKFRTGWYVDNDSDHTACFPDYDPADLVAIGHILLKNDTGSDFTIGTTDISDSSITNTITDVRTILPGQEIG